MEHLHKPAIFKISVAVIFVLLLFSGLLYAQQRVAVNAKIANLRSDAGTGNDVLWQVEKFHPFMVIQKKGKWYKIRDFENDEAWIHNSLVGSVASVITLKDKCNVRSKPTTKSSILFTTERGVPFRVIKKKGNWVKVEHADGDIGWIHKSLIW